MRRLSGWFSVVVGSVLILGSGSAARAQDGQTGAGTPSLKAPQLNSSATGEVELRPDRATLTLSVESRGVTASKAGSETARRQKQVLDTLRALGIGADQLQTASLQINPEYSNPAPGQRQRVSGYVAVSSIRVEVLRIDQVGSVVDAGLSGEATGIQGLRFSSSKEPEARRQALALAVTKARGEAESMALAAGGTLGGLIELNAQPDMVRMYGAPALSFASRASAPMPVAEGMITVSATVSGRWGFIPR